MLLVIPSIEIQSGKCRRNAQGLNGAVYSPDPVESAKLWRKENAKALYVSDVDAALEGRMANLDAIRSIVKAVDIPVLLGGGMRTFADAQRAFEIGVYRVVISKMLMENRDDARKTLELFTAAKVVVGIDARNGVVETREGGRKGSAVEYAALAKELGFKRIMYTDVVLSGDISSPNVEAIKTLAASVPGLKITAAGGVSGLDDLLKLQELEPLGIDSVVIGKALYENRFACQGIWRVCEAGDFPYTARV
jgi:phosphoribosylformimino-5-aminoimidazole carboxamide ribotide isomerase